MKDPIHQLQEELKQLRRHAQHRNVQRGLEIDGLQSKATQAQKKLQVALERARSFVAFIPLYLSCTRKAQKIIRTTKANAASSSHYYPPPPLVLAMETELLRHIHRMCIYQTQLILLNRQSENSLQTIKQYLVKVTNKSFQTQVQLLSDICVMEREIHDSENLLLLKLEDSQVELSLCHPSCGGGGSGSGDNERSTVLPPPQQQEEQDKFDKSNTHSPLPSILKGIHTILSSSSRTTKSPTTTTTNTSEVLTSKNVLQRQHWKVPSCGAAFAFLKKHETFQTVHQKVIMSKENKKTLPLDNIVTTKAA